MNLVYKYECMSKSRHQKHKTKEWGKKLFVKPVD